MIQEMRAGAMPPGEAGRRVREQHAMASQVRRIGPLPPIESAEAQEIVRNWLACQAPVIARTEIPPPSGSSSNRAQRRRRDLHLQRAAGDLPDPMWSEIYWSIMFTECVICHGPPNGNVDQNPDNPLGGDIPGGASARRLAALDLTGSDTTDTSNWPSDSWSAVVDALASTQGMCAGRARS